MGKASGAHGTASAEPLAPDRRPLVRNSLVGLLVGVLGFGIVTAVRSASAVAPIDAARPDQLVSILDGLSTRQAELEAERQQLLAAQAAIGSGDPAKVVAEARDRANTLAILAGTVPVTGPGVTVTITVSEEARAQGIGASTVLDAVQELRDAGAEALAITGAGATGRSVRIGVSTWFADGPNGQLLVSGSPINGNSWSITAIGDPATLSTALEIPGGITATVRTAGGSAEVRRSEGVRIAAVLPGPVPPR